MKLKRVIQLKKEGETLTLEMDTNSRNYLHCLSLIEERVKEFEDIYDDKIRVPKSTPKKKKDPLVEAHIKLTESKEGTAFDSIPLDTTDFNLSNVEIKRIGEPQSGDRKDGGTWQMQSVSIKDTKGKTRELIAWGDHNAQFDSLKVGDMIDIDLLSKVTEYKNKKGVVTIQYQLSGNTEIKGAD